MDITWIIPQPEAVRVGARTYLASPLRLRDLARLQGYLRSRQPCPLDGARPAIDAAAEGSEARRRLLRDAYLACEAWPIRLASDEGQRLIRTSDGLKYWLAVLLSVDNPIPDARTLDELAAAITPAQYETLVRIAFGAHPLDSLKPLISPESYPESSGANVTDWGQLARRIIEETGWTFEQVADLRLTQLAVFESKGEAGTGEIPVPPGMTPFQFSRRQKAFFGPNRDQVEGEAG